MKRRFARLAPAVAVLLLGGLTMGCGSDGPPEVAATVAGAEVRSSEVERLTDLYLRSDTSLETEAKVKSALGRDDAARFVLVYLIRLAYLERLAAEVGVDISRKPADAMAAAGQASPEDLQALGWSRGDFVETFRAARLSRTIAERVLPDVTVADGELRQDYDRHPEAFGPSWEARVGVAFFDADAPARSVAERVGGGEGFVAAAQSLGARAATTLDRVTPLTALPPPVLQAVASAPLGQVSDPVSGGGGSVVFVVERRVDVPARSFDAAKEELRARRLDQERQRQFITWFDRRLGKEPVRVSGHYGRWDREHHLVTT
ncbi:MAG TPA: peptidylprolyl isomerase [Acidimicrobiia bacterium]